MKVGVIGLGRMGGPIARKFHKSDCELTVYDINPAVCQEFKNDGIHVSENIEELSKISDVIWIMVSALAVDDVLEELCLCTREGTVLIDGGNSYFKDTIRRAKEMARRKIEFLDCGTSGGLRGVELGFSLTVGGDKESYDKIKEIFNLIAASKRSYSHVGPSGAGHYVKMVHNGIEYALMESYAEGFHLLHNGYYKNLDLSKVSCTWSNGSIIRSWILTLIEEIYSQDQDLENIRGIVGAHGTGYWTVKEAQKEGIPVRLIEDAVKIREESRKDGNYATKLVALLRHKMGGHPIEQRYCKECELFKEE